MEMKLSEIKAVIRSILISSSVVINVFELNNDFKEQEGIGIPYKELGYNSLWGFLKSIPDVLMVEGDSYSSEVILVTSEKSSHVNELVLKQKLSKKRGAFHSKFGAQTKKNKHFYHAPKLPTKESHNKSTIAATVAKPDDGYCSQKSSSDKSNTNSKDEKVPEQKSHQSEEISNITEKNCSIIDLTKPTQRLSSENKNSENSPKNEIKENILGSETVIIESTKFLRRINYKDDSHNVDKCNNVDDSLNEDECRNLDLSLKASGKQIKTDYWRGGTTRQFEQNKNTVEYSSEEENFHNFEKCIKSSSSKTSLDATKNSRYDLRRSWPLKSSKQKNKQKKCEFQNVSCSVIKNSRTASSNSKNRRKLQNFIPIKVQDNLQKLISDFPEGLWCTELPTVYRNLIGEDLLFEEFGYRCLSHLCFDLGNIFHCIKESLCDYKLYDARKPLPEMKFLQEQIIPSQSNSNSSAIDLTPGIPEISWSGFDLFLPKDVVKLGNKVQRIQVADILEAGVSINVVVAEVYDISKFWIYLDDSKLDRLMSEMQMFYEMNKGYFVPKSLLAEGLHCVVLYHAKFHRAVILNVMPDEDYVKVYYLDYGTLGTSPKSDIWFMTCEFSDLPGQAIRARLSDIYPPYGGVTWSPFANYDFSKYTCMKKLIAEIVRVDKHKNLLDIRLKNIHSSYISDILVNRKYAIFINKTPKKHIEDTNCKSRVKYIHLFPTFEEIENWVVPSKEEATDFLNTPVSADFLYSQYFTRNVDIDLINSIEEKMKIISRKRRTLLQYIDPEELLSVHSIEETNKVAYGEFYDPSLTVSRNDIEENCVNEVLGEVDSRNDSWADIEDDETLARILRQTRMKQLCSFEDKELQEDVNNYEEKQNSEYLKMSVLRSSTNGTEEEPRESDSSGPLMKMKSPFWQRFCDKGSREVSNFSELEKYLSEEDSSKKSTPNPKDSDNGYLNPINSSTNLLLGSEFEQSLLELARSRQCLSTESLRSNMEKCVLVNPLDLPIPSNIKDNSLSFDLMQFDSTSEATSNSDPKEILRCNGSKHFFKDGSDLSDADDEDSDTKQNGSKYTQKCRCPKAIQMKFLDESTESNPAIKNYDVSKSTQKRDRSLLRHDISNIDQNVSQMKVAPRDRTIKNVPAMADVSQFACSRSESDLDSVVLNQSIIRKKQFSSSNTKSCYSNSIDPGEFDNFEASKAPTASSITDQTEVQTSKLSHYSKIYTDERKNLNNDDMVVDQSGSSTNFYYSCESEQSSIPDSSHEMVFDFDSSSSNGNSTDKDKNFLKEINIIDDTSALDSTSDLRSEARKSSLSIVSEEWISTPNVQREIDGGSPHVLHCTVPEHLTQKSGSDMDIDCMSSNLEIIEESQINFIKNNEGHISPNSMNVSNIVHNVWESPVSPVIQSPQFSYSSNNMHQPQMVVRRPPPGFHPIPAYGYNGVPVPNSIQYLNSFIVPNIPIPSFSLQHPEMFNGLTHYHGTYPLVVLNYNVIPPVNQNRNSELP